MQLLRSPLSHAPVMLSLCLFCLARRTLRLCIQRAPLLLEPIRKPPNRLLVQHPGLLLKYFVDALEAVGRVPIGLVGDL
jgi:hypothetical protein